MTPPQLGTVRAATGWARQALVKKEWYTAQTSISVEEELWLFVRQYAEVQTVCESLVAERCPAIAGNPAALREAWLDVRALLRQAETFYRAAGPLHWKSASLNHYYAFLNLAKALLRLNGALTTGRVHHGLSSVEPGRADLADQWAVKTRRGVFSMLYEQQVGRPLPKGQATIGDLLGYCGPVGAQYVESGRASRLRIAPGLRVVLTNADQRWDVLAFPNIAVFGDDPNIPPGFAARYEEVQPPVQIAYQAFDLNANQAHQHRFYQARQADPIDQAQRSKKEAIAAFGDALSDVTSPKYDFVANRPCPFGAGFIPMNEMLATYMTTFFMSELVRYYPDRLDLAADTRDCWLLESFARSAPLQLLKHLVSEIRNQSILLEFE